VRSVITKQWTTISVAELGSGPDPVVFVHDTAYDHQEAIGLASALGAQYGVLVPDRRGRGDSEDEPHYGLAREAESDILAVVNSCRSPVLVIGHGYGASLCVRMAPLAQTPIRAMILIDGGIVSDASSAGVRELVRAADEMDASLAADDVETVVMTHLVRVSGLADDHVAELRTAPTWTARCGGARTAPRETRGMAAASLSSEQARGIRAPTMLVQSDCAPAWVRDGYESARAVWPQVTRSELSGQAPFALENNPEELAALINDFTTLAAKP
jgi:pimeloyl-ACP methyl ester carboxylesterase